jgi:hypothetical protein
MCRMLDCHPSKQIEAGMQKTDWMLLLQREGKIEVARQHPVEIQPEHAADILQDLL